MLSSWRAVSLGGGGCHMYLLSYFLSIFPCSVLCRTSFKKIFGLTLYFSSICTPTVILTENRYVIHTFLYLSQYLFEFFWVQNTRIPIECKLPRCNFKLQKSCEDLEKHVDESHLSRIALDCPIRGKLD